MSARNFIEQLKQQHPLSRSDAYALMCSMAEEKLSSKEVEELLTSLTLRLPSADEISGFRAALLERARPLDLSQFQTLDICGCGGDGKSTFNISTCAAFIVAAAGYSVVKHGNYGSSSSAGSSNVLEALGVKFPQTESEVLRQLEYAGIVFLHAPNWHPAIKSVAPIRKKLGVRTVFNILGPLLNPAKPQAQLIGAPTRELQDLYGEVLHRENIEFCVVHSLDGYDEISLTGPARLLTGADDELLHPEDFGAGTLRPDSLLGGRTAEEAAQILTKALEPESQTPHTAVAIANAAAAIRTANPALSRKGCLEAAIDSVGSGKAKDLLLRCSGDNVQTSVAASPPRSLPRSLARPTILDEIAAHKRHELETSRAGTPIRELEKRSLFEAPRISLRAALLGNAGSGIIAEIKRRSPSRGALAKGIKIELIAAGYVDAGASAISVLTDERYFGGSLEDLERTRTRSSVPVLRKDFVLDEYQLYEARAFGADAVLLIAAMLKPAVARALSESAKRLGLEVLLEVHSKEEIEGYVSDSIDIIGVNNRDLRDFTTDVRRSFELREFLPSHLAAISESGLSSSETILSLKSAGYHGFLIGEAFMTSADPAAACAKLVQQIGGIKQIANAQLEISA